MFLYLSATSGGICASSCAHSRWKVVGTDCTQNWKSLLLRMMPAQISAMPLAMVETTTARIKDVDIWPCGAGSIGVTRRRVSIIRHQRVFGLELYQVRLESILRDLSSNSSHILFFIQEKNLCLFGVIPYLRRQYMWHCRWPGLLLHRRDRGRDEYLRLACSSAFDSGCSSAAPWSHTRRDSPWLEGTMCTHIEMQMQRHTVTWHNLFVSESDYQVCRMQSNLCFSQIFYSLGNQRLRLYSLHIGYVQTANCFFGISRMCRDWSYKVCTAKKPNMKCNLCKSDPSHIWRWSETWFTSDLCRLCLSPALATITRLGSVFCVTYENSSHQSWLWG